MTVASFKRPPESTFGVREAPPPADLDRSVLDRLRILEQRCAGLVQRVVSTYLNSSTELLARLRTSAARADARELFEAAHALTSSSLNVGAVSLAQSARALEADARAGWIDGSSTLLERIENEHRRVCLALLEYLPRRPA
jgi:HPt (histidine-containing phosphotransfer) domain-containing protein